MTLKTANLAACVQGNVGRRSFKGRTYNVAVHLTCRQARAYRVHAFAQFAILSANQHSVLCGFGI